MDEQKKKELLAALAGAQQGTTFGLADELGGAAGALGSKFGGDKRDLSDLYKEARDENRQEYKQKEEENPKAFMAGELGSALLTPAALRGAAGMVGGGAVSAMGRSAETDPKLLALEAIKGGAKSALFNKLGGQLSKIKSGSVGAIAKDIEELAPEKLTTNIASGGAYKAIGRDAAGEPMISALSDDYLKASKDAIPKFSNLSDMILAAKRGMGNMAAPADKLAEKVLPKVGEEVLDSGIPEKITQSYINSLKPDKLQSLFDKYISSGKYQDPVVTGAIMARINKFRR